MSMPAPVAHAIRRIIAGSADVDLESIPAGPFRTLAGRLDVAPVDGRPGVLELFAESRDDGPAIIEAVARADPSAPPAEGPEAEDIPWEPIRLDDPIPVDPFPLEVLPLAARQLAIEAARSVGCPVDFPAAATLAVAAGVIGRSAVLKLKAGYFASSALWIAVVGPPSDGKSPAVDAAFGATSPIDRDLQAEHAAAMGRWRDERHGKDGPEAPRPRRLDVDDCTTEALAGILADSPRGLIQFKDELAGFLHGMDQYRAGAKGSDRPKYCSIWAGKRLKIDRAKNPSRVPIRVDRPCLSLFGPLVPDRLGSLVADGGGADGFLDRFLFAFPAQLRVPPWSDKGVDDEVADAWRDLVRRLWDRPMAGDEGEPSPHIVLPNGDGRDAWVARHAGHVAEMNDDEFPAHLRGPWGKLREYAGRLALVLALMHHAGDPGNDPGEIPDVTAADVHRAWNLVAYFASHARKVYGRVGGLAPGDAERQAALRWIRDAPRASFSVSELTQARKTLRNNPDLNPALARLVREGILRPVPDPPGQKFRSPRYLVHPDLAGGPGAAGGDELGN